MSSSEEDVDGGRLLEMVQAVAISPDDAIALVDGYHRGSAREGMSEAAINEAIADRIVARYAKVAGAVGGASGLVGLVPGLCTVVGVTGGVMATRRACRICTTRREPCASGASTLESS